MNKILESLNTIQHKDRPNVYDYINNIFSDFIELKGDRLYGDDKAIIGGIATLKQKTVTVIGQIRGHNLTENIQHNFSMSMPEGYRKALRLMKQAEKFNRPIICFVDTVGADPGVQAEERGQGSAIANSIMEIMNLKTIIISVIIGDSRNSGALVFCIADRVAMLENVTLSITPPKRIAETLWRASIKEVATTSLFEIPAKDLLQLGIIDFVIPESLGGAYDNPILISERIRQYLINSIKALSCVSSYTLVKNRNEKYRNMDIQQFTH